MPLSAPSIDPAPLFDLYRGRLSTEILSAVACRTDFFRALGADGADEDALQKTLGWSRRAFSVVTTAIRAMRLLDRTSDGRFVPTAMSKMFLDPASEFALTGYLGLSADSPAVKAFLEAIERTAPEAATESGTAFTYRSDKPSAMDDPQFARFLTMSLAGRGRAVAPAVVTAAPPLPNESTLLDIGGGSGWYSIAYLKANPRMKAVVWDRPEVLKVAAENAAAEGVSDRLSCVGGDMFADPFPVSPELVIVSNILHDWDEPEILRLLRHWREQSKPGTRLILHDVFLNDALDGPLPIALYSADLFLLTEGRAYSRAEYLEFFRMERWTADPEQQPRSTLAHCGVLEAFATSTK
jgi:hypothetical protein